MTGLKFDIFGAHNSNTSVTDIFGLVEGYLPSEKTVNVVLSMLHHSRKRARSPTFDVERDSKKFILHSDNCAGQNRNQFVHFYVLWIAALGFDVEVFLYFLVAGQTKNVFDSSF